MKWYLKILFIPVLLVNLLVAVLLMCCAYSPVLPAEHMPLLSLAGLAFPFVLAANVVFLFVWLLLYKPFMLVSIVTLVICFSQIRAFVPINIARQKPPVESFKLVSYNILSSNLKASTANRENPLISYLEECGADVICLQEFPFASLKSKGAEDLPAEYPYRSYQLSDLSELKSHFLCCLSKYPILSVEKVDLNSTGNGCARYQILHDADTIVIYNCHLQSNNLNAENKTTYEQLLSEPNKDKIKAEGTRELALIATDGGDGYDCDHADWINPTVTLADGSTIDLTAKKYLRGTCGWGSIAVNRNLSGGTLSINGKKYAKGLATHANSILLYSLPEGATRFTAFAGIDNTGSDQGSKSSMEFMVFASDPTIRKETTDQWRGGNVTIHVDPTRQVATSGFIGRAAGVQQTVFGGDERW